jgi:hypothetical protein
MTTMSKTKKFRRVPILGIILIGVGLLLLMDQLKMLDLTFWSFVTGFMILFGATLVIRSFNEGNRSKVFWGTVLFFFGLYFLLDSMNLITAHYPVFVPAFFLILGFSFLMMYIYNVRDWHLLIPTFFFIGVGFVIVADELSLLRTYRFEHYLYHYWPLLLILFGLGLIAKSRRRQRHPVESAPAVDNPVES